MTVQNILFFFFPQETWLCYFASTHLVSNSNNTTNKMKNLKKFIQNSVCVFGGGGGGSKSKDGLFETMKASKITRFTSFYTCLTPMGLKDI